MNPTKHTLKRTLFAAIAGLVVGTPALADDKYPQAVQHLVERGVTITGQFDAPSDMTGYVGEMQGQPVAFYLTSDRQHVVIGPMLTADGENLTDPKVQELVLGPKNEQAWADLEKASWVRDGDADAPVVVYTFTDPNCPYCHRFRQSAEPWIAAGRVQLRHVLVGILKQDSLPKAATILGADDPQQALGYNQSHYGEGGVEVNREIVSKHAAKVQENNRLMSRLGLSATPSTYYRTADGGIRMKQGAPRPEEMEAIMGSPQP